MQLPIESQYVQTVPDNLNAEVRPGPSSRCSVAAVCLVPIGSCRWLDADPCSAAALQDNTQALLLLLPLQIVLGTVQNIRDAASWLGYT